MHQRTLLISDDEDQIGLLPIGKEIIDGHGLRKLRERETTLERSTVPRSHEIVECGRVRVARHAWARCEPRRLLHPSTSSTEPGLQASDHIPHYNLKNEAKYLHSILAAPYWLLRVAGIPNICPFGLIQ